MLNVKSVGEIALKFLQDERGATAIEYALIGSIMGVGLIVSLGSLEDATTGAMNTTGDSIDGSLP